ncbi:hypothetical protein SEA_DAUBENSKI_28 [Streptomyces phage Daubenski]|uniref:Uncharacterized protein n=1 Tax=Streptomyces phage Daubenski TaxID=2653725 RepID=A0A5Q2WG12_9CAUD|nr:hypothetical protein KNU80_gp028 [Streptomyces phage Daubenski]QGH76338.1 hypothetical protein SEA_DAUBENSKI_28 [Streptomyces phage Daubenski]
MTKIDRYAVRIANLQPFPGARSIVETVDVINRGNETIRFTIKTGTDVVFIVEKNTPVEK